MNNRPWSSFRPDRYYWFISPLLKKKRIVTFPCRINPFEETPGWQPGWNHSGVAVNGVAFSRNQRHGSQMCDSGFSWRGTLGKDASKGSNGGGALLVSNCFIHQNQPYPRKSQNNTCISKSDLIVSRHLNLPIGSRIRQNRRLCFMTSKELNARYACPYPKGRQSLLVDSSKATARFSLEVHHVKKLIPYPASL